MKFWLFGFHFKRNGFFEMKMCRIIFWFAEEELEKRLQRVAKEN